jgi:L-threonylcarbamoyladenylate synthase
MNLINVEQTVELLRAGELVVVPTDTVYGIACDYANAEAVKKVYQIKGRSEEKPLVVLISSLEMLNEVAEEITGKHKLLMERFWPGGLTLLFRRSGRISDVIAGGGLNIGVRMPAQEVTLSIIKNLGRPIVATSVNKSGSVSLIDLEEIFEVFPGLAIVDGGEMGGLRVESTVLDLTGEKPSILRKGAVTKEQIENVLGEEVF